MTTGLYCRAWNSGLSVELRVVSVPPLLNMVVPCYNEELILLETARRLSDLVDRVTAEGLVASGSGVYFIDDGSRDGTWAIIAGLSASRPDRWHGIKLTRNCGHQNALMAGLTTAPGDVIVSIDADLQDDIEVIRDMIKQYHAGCHIVYGVRNNRDSDTGFKRRTALIYYRLLSHLGVEIVENHADFRLMSRRALEALARYSEVNLFLRAIVPLLGLKTGIVTYQRHPRLAGVSKYPLARMIGLAANGVTSFSMRPLRFITVMGLVVSGLSMAVSIWAIGVRLFSASAVPGWTSILVPLSFIGGLQLLALGVIGEYIGKIYLEVKHRPRFDIELIV